MTDKGRTIVHGLRDGWNRSSDEIPALREMRDWYRRWVRMREIRYQYLATILDDVDGYRHAGQRQRASAEPRSAAGRSQCIGVPSIDSGGNNRLASPQVVRSISGERSDVVSAASGDAER